MQHPFCQNSAPRHDQNDIKALHIGTNAVLIAQQGRGSTDTDNSNTESV
jgi:hypothetical protein